MQLLENVKSPFDILFPILQYICYVILQSIFLMLFFYKLNQLGIIVLNVNHPLIDLIQFYLIYFQLVRQLLYLLIQLFILFMQERIIFQLKDLFILMGIHCQLNKVIRIYLDGLFLLILWAFKTLYDIRNGLYLLKLRLAIKR